MAIKTSVDGNRVTMGESVYNVAPSSGGKCTVSDDFGGKLGTFVVRGTAIEPDDYGVEGAHPIVQIAKLWVAANQAKSASAGAGPQSKMVCRVVTHDRPADADLEKARAHRAWLKKVPGCKAAYLAQDAATGKTLSFSLWETREQLTALKDHAPPDGAAPLKASSTETFQLIEDP